MRAPSRKASTKTTTSGSTRKKARNTSASPIRAARTWAGSVSGSRMRASGMDRSSLAVAGSATLPPPRPGLQEVDREEKNERRDQHERGDHGRAGVVELLELDDDEQRHDLRVSRHVAGDEDHRPVLADGAREGEGEPGENRREQRRQDDPPQDMEAARPQERRCLLVLPLALPQHRLDGPYDEGQADEDERDQDAEGREGDAEVEARQGPPDPARRRVQRGQGDAGDRGRQSERQVDQRIDETPAWKPVAHEDPRDEDTEDGVDESGEERGSEADAERRERARV